ncbi:unnamed protein product, partial [Pylaiella littoralis]
VLKLATAGTPEIGSLDSGRSGNDGKFDVEQEKFSSIDAQGQQALVSATEGVHDSSTTTAVCGGTPADGMTRPAASNAAAEAFRPAPVSSVVGGAFAAFTNAAWSAATPPSTAVPAGTVGAAAVSQSPSSPSEIAGVSASLCSSAATLPHLAGNTGSTGGAATFDSVSSPGAYGGASALSAPGGTSSPCSSP